MSTPLTRLKSWSWVATCVAVTVVSVGCSTPVVGGDAAPDVVAMGATGMDSAPDAVTIDAAPADRSACPAGQLQCNGRCVDPQVDRANCGACGTACAAGQVCSMGMCATSCTAGLTNCSGSCVNGNNAPANCSACGTVCPARASATSVCAAGRCAFVCDANRGDCDGNTANGCETNTATATNNCGGCGVLCPVGNACVAGVCRSVSDCRTNPNWTPVTCTTMAWV